MGISQQMGTLSVLEKQLKTINMFDETIHGVRLDLVIQKFR